MRVIAGELRGRRLLAVPGSVRPTADRVREAIFSRLGAVSGARVLDLYAGTGALGIEALSRGAKHATFVDRAPSALASLRRNLARFGLRERARVIRADAVVALERFARGRDRFDLVAIDPPYASDEAQRALCALARARVLAAGAVVVVETATRHSLDPVSGLLVEDERSYGGTQITQLRAGDRESADREWTDSKGGGDETR